VYIKAGGMKQIWSALGMLALCTYGLTGCSSDHHLNDDPGALRSRLNTYSPPVAGNDYQEVLNAQAQQMRKVEVTISGPVFKMLPDDTKGLPHERWLMQLSNGSTVLIAHDTKLAPRVPINNGDMVRIHGEYIWNDKGGVIHWTHHAPNGRHEPGWVEFNGQKYE
jgi:hypothetical protein